MEEKKQEIKIIIGANYGDEGKGLMTDYFAEESKVKNKRTLVICSNGGAQRGHTVTKGNGDTFVFHHFGSGTFANADTYFPKYFILNPIIFKNDHDKLNDINIIPTTYTNKDCIWTTPYDMIINQISEEYRGSKRHGSCGVGIWETIVRSKKIHAPISSFKNNKEECIKYLKEIRDSYFPERLNELGIPKQAYEKWIDIIDNPGLIDSFIDDIDFFLRSTVFVSDDIMNIYDCLIFECGQGLLLNGNRKEYKEHTTPSNTGLQNPAQMCLTLKNKPSNIEVCYVSRTYVTRHGAGPFDNECDVSVINPKIYDSTNIPNEFQGEIRYGLLNIDVLIKNIMEDYLKYKNNDSYNVSLSITHMNETNNKINNRDEINFNKLKEAGIHNIYISNGKTNNEVKII